MNLTELTIVQIHQGLKKKSFSALEVCKAYLNSIKEKNGEISAFLSVNEDVALSRAKEVDNMILAGQRISTLAGIPCAIKDNILIKGLPCTAGSKTLDPLPS